MTFTDVWLEAALCWTLPVWREECSPGFPGGLHSAVLATSFFSYAVLLQ